MINTIKNYLARNPHALPVGTNLFTIEKMLCELNETKPTYIKEITFEQYKDRYIYLWRSVPCSGWNDPNEGWHYSWQEYIRSSNLG